MIVSGSANPLLLGQSQGYNLTRSLRFRASASGYLNRTPASAGNRQTWTWSGWVKRGTLGTSQGIFAAATSGSALAELYFNTSNALSFYDYTGAYNLQLVTTQVFRDPSAWYHIVVALDTTNATAANRVKIYVNGVQVTALSTATYPSQNYQGYVNNNIAHYTSSYNGSTDLYDGYLAEVNFVNGLQLTPSSFGSTNALTGVWQPAAYTGTYGTNGFYLPFTDNSALTTSSNVGLGKDFSGNANYWVTNNISITAGVTYDSMTDVPTLTSVTAANYCVLNPLACGSYITLSSANLQATGSATDQAVVSSTMQITTPFYWECKVITKDGGGNFPRFGAISTFPTNFNGTFIASATTGGVAYRGNGDVVKNSNVAVGTYTALAANDVLGFALDPANQTCAIYLNNVLKVTVTGITAPYFPAVESYTTSGVGVVNFGQRPFSYTPPTGYVALNTYNLPTSTIVKGNTVMDATLYTGTLLSNAITNAASFKPDLVWVKSRSAATDHKLTDSVRGVTKGLISDTTGAETTDTQGLTAFGSAGFTVGTDTNYNNLAATYVAWQWQAGQGSSSSNTNGSITSTVSVNASAGFSVVTYTGTGVAATVGHGLGVAPSLMIVKRRDAVAAWDVYHASIGATGRLYLNTTDATNTSSAPWNNTAPTSSVFTVGTATDTNASASTLVAYCWTPIAGFSAFGSYTGNGSADGPFVYTGFRPKFIMIKNTGYDNNQTWVINDTARSTYNVDNITLRPNSSTAESTTNGSDLDELSNGFKIRNSNTVTNASGTTIIYAAFAENPFKNSLAR